MIIAGTIENPLIQHLIYLKVGKFVCNKKMTLMFLKESLNTIRSSFLKVKLIITDAVSYNISAKKDVVKKYEHIRWVTCYSHLLHNCCSTITKFFKSTTNFIILMNDLVYSSDTYNYILPGSLKPQEVVLTRWGTYLKAIKYYSSHFNYIKEFIERDDFNTKPERNKRIKNLVLSNPCIFEELCIIEECYGFLEQMITTTEKKGFSILDAEKSIKTVDFKHDPANINEYFLRRVNENDLSMIFRNQDNEDHKKILCCPSTTVDVERAFSLLNNLISKTRKFDEKNVIKYFFPIFKTNQEKYESK